MSDILELVDIEFLVRYVDKICDWCEDSNEMQTKRGDVIAAKISPCSWSAREHENSHWRILKASGVTRLFYLGITEKELPSPGISDETHVLRQRVGYIDFSVLPSDLQTEIENDQELSRPLTAEEIYAAFKKKGPPKLRVTPMGDGDDVFGVTIG